MKRTLTLTAVALAMAVSGGAIAQERADTVIFDLDRTIKDPENFNWFTSGTKRQHGAHQSMWEPLFILNYTTGELDPWLATGIESNDDFTEWTLAIREGVTWSDGEIFDADDVVFTANLALNNEDLSQREAANLRSQVASVEKMGDLSVKFVLKSANPRFATENFGVRIFGSFFHPLEPVRTHSHQPPPTGPSGIGTMTGGVLKAAFRNYQNRNA